jgi:polysaccharide biosynthesis protein PslH
MNVLFLCHRIPFPPNKGDKIRSFNELLYLSRRHNIYLATILDRESDRPDLRTLEQYCTKIFAVRFNRKVRLLMSLFSGKPFSISNFYCRELQTFIDETLEKEEIGAVICYCSSMAEYVFNNPRYLKDGLRGTQLIMDFVDLDSDKWHQFARYSRFPANLIYRIENTRLLRYEIRVNASFAHSVFVSQREVLAFSAMHSPLRATRVIPNGVDYTYYAPCDRRNDSLTIDSRPVLVFTGVMDYFANEDGVKWFCSKIYPKIKSCFRDAEFYIVGNRPTNAVKKLAKIQGVHVTGFVEDIRRYYWMADICVIPLRIARGLQNKVLEAMATGSAVVATSNASEGIVCHRNEDIIIADEEESFAQAVIDLVQDGPRRRQLGLAAIDNIRKHYSWDENLRGFHEILQAGCQ